MYEGVLGKILLRIPDLPPSTSLRDGRSANNIRYQFANFLISPPVSNPWQMSKIEVVLSCVNFQMN